MYIVVNKNNVYMFICILYVSYYNVCIMLSYEIKFNNNCPMLDKFFFCFILHLDF